MICQYFKLPATQKDVMQELLAFQDWTIWWPGLKSLDVVSSDGQTGIVDAVFKLAATVSMRVEFNYKDNHLITFRQLKGWFKFYEGEWFLQPAPDGVGIVLKVSMRLECSAFVPRSMVQSKLSENLSRFGPALVARLQSQKDQASTSSVRNDLSSLPGNAQAQPTPVKKQALARKPIHVFQTTTGLEAWIEGRRHMMKLT